MFDFFRKRTAGDFVAEAKKTYLQPESKTVPPMPEVKPPKEEKPAQTYYRIGLTSDNRVSFQMGYSEITMNAAGVDNLIAQLELFKDQLVSEPTEEVEE